MNQEALSNGSVLPGSASGQMLVKVFFSDLDVNTVNSQLINLRMTGTLVEWQTMMRTTLQVISVAWWA